MKIPARIAAPIILAIVCAAVLIGFLWWQLVQSVKVLETTSNQPENQQSEQTQTTIMRPIDARDQALLSLREGDLLALRGEWADAQQSYEQAVEAGGGLPALRKLAQAQLQRRNYEGVRESLRQLRRAGARSEDLLLIESIMTLRQGELVDARRLLENADDSPQKHYGLALLAIQEGNHTMAQDELNQVIGGWEPVLRSYARTLQSSYQEFSLFPESQNIHLITLLSRALAQVQECELALPMLVQVTQVTGDYRDAWIVQGFCELITERPQEALVSLETAYNLDPQKPEIQYFLARAYADLDNHRNAITFFEYALENGFKPAGEVRRRIAQEALDVGDSTLALQQYEALAKDPEATIDIFEGYIAASIALGQLDEAYLIGQQAAERWPESAVAYDLLGWSALEAKHPDEARTALEKALQLNPALTSAKERIRTLE